MTFIIKPNTKVNHNQNNHSTIIIMQKNTKETKEPKTRTNKKVVYSESEDEEMSPDTIERTSKFLV